MYTVYSYSGTGGIPMPFPKILLRKRLWIGVVAVVLFGGAYLYVHMMQARRSLFSQVHALRWPVHLRSHIMTCSHCCIMKVVLISDSLASRRRLIPLPALFPCFTGFPWVTLRHLQCVATRSRAIPSLWMN